MKKCSYLLLITTLIISLSSCAAWKRIEYVDREVVRYVHNTVHDTLRDNIHDSIYFEVKERNETVFATKYVEHIQYRDIIREKIDTIVRDSVIIEYKENTVEKRVVPKWCYIVTLISWLIIGVLSFILYLKH